MTKNVMQIQPVRTRLDHIAAVKRIEALMDAGVKPGTPEDDELEIWFTLVDAYEAKAFPIDAPDPVTAIQFCMEQQGLSRKDIEPYIGSRARVSEIMNGKRQLTLDMVQRVREGLGISADLLIARHPYQLAPIVNAEMRANKINATKTAPKGDGRWRSHAGLDSRVRSTVRRKDAAAKVANPLEGESGKSGRARPGKSERAKLRPGK
jgi:HTH-type transcriptional regulator/antitoxin HigA